MLLRWVNMADLFRVKGIGEHYSDLLEAAGVDTVLLKRKEPLKIFDLKVDEMVYSIVSRID
jgi:hypothetical protein